MKTSQHSKQILLTDIGLDDYQDFVETHPDSTIFHHKRWIDLLCDQHGFTCRIPAVKLDGKIIAAVPFLETQSLFGTKKLVSLPFTDALAVLADADSVPKLKRRLESESYRHYSAIVARTQSPTEIGASSDVAWLRHTVDTSRSIDHIYSDFDRRLKTNIRRAERSHLTYSCNTSAEAMQKFYELQVKTRRKIGVPVQPRRFFSRLQEQIIEQDFGFIGLVNQGDKSIAAGVFLFYNGTMIYKYSAADPQQLSCRPNEFLAFNAIRSAVDLDCHLFDFGISKPSQTGLRRYKTKFGAVESNVYREVIAGEQQTLPEDSKAMALASMVIKNSPEFVCKAIGESLYKYSQ